jgi:hypothetical protein
VCWIIPYRWREGGRRYALYFPFDDRAGAERFRARLGIR